MSQGTIKKGWTTGFFTAPDSIYDAPISGYAKAVYVYLCRRADAMARSYPGYGRIASDTGFSKKTVIRAVAELVECGLLVKKFRGRKKTKEYETNEYTLVHPDDVVFDLEENEKNRGKQRSKPEVETPKKKEGVVSQTILPPGGSMVSEGIPMVSQTIGSVNMHRKGLPTKDHLPTDHESKSVSNSLSVHHHHQDTNDDDDLGKISIGVQATKKTVHRWLVLADGDRDRIEAAKAEAVLRKARNPIGYVTTLLSDPGWGPLDFTERTGKGTEHRKAEKRPKGKNYSGQANREKYAAFYALMEAAATRETAPPES